MKLTVQECFDICKRVAPRYGFDPYLILAMCQQESALDYSEVRLEQGFYRRYARPQGFATTVEVLLAASYGLMQCMGQSLYEMGFFEPMEYGAVPRKIDEYMVQPELQVELGCKWLQRKQQLVASGDVRRMLLKWNGGGDPDYPERVLNRVPLLKLEVQ